MELKAEVTFVFEYDKIVLCEDKRSVLIIGYKTELTEKEYEIVRILIDSKRMMHKREIAKLAEIADSAVAVHIANINKKALPITSRKLLVGNRRGEYSLAENL
ncbi:MAG: hypothetical protein IKJ24_05045 [Clostridia bacterium]|nr:hypothetical protein [Clostridia bacterium]